MLAAPFCFNISEPGEPWKQNQEGKRTASTGPERSHGACGSVADENPGNSGKVVYCYRNYPLKTFLSMIKTMISDNEMAMAVITKMTNVDKATNQPMTKSNEAAGSKCG